MSAKREWASVQHELEEARDALRAVAEKLKKIASEQSPDKVASKEALREQHQRLLKKIGDLDLIECNLRRILRISVAPNPRKGKPDA